MPIKNPRITKEQAKEELLKIYNILGRNPTRNEFYKLCTLVGCHEKAINILFGKNPWYGLMVYSGLTGIRSQAQPRQEVECLQCKKIFKKTVGEINKSPNHFCSRSCAATFNNKETKTKHGKYKKNKICSNCGVIHAKDSYFCSQKCKTESSMKNRTIEDALKEGTRQQRYSNIRSIARSYAKYLPNKNKCQNCGYDKHVEIAHIKSISSFSLNDVLIDVNNENNLLALCPNCHWEFDNGHLTLEQILE